MPYGVRIFEKDNSGNKKSKQQIVKVVIEPPVPTLSQTPTLTFTATPSLTATNTVTPTLTNTPTLTATLTATPTLTATGTPSPTLTLTATPTSTESPTLTPTNTPAATETATPTPSLTSTETPTLTATPSLTLTNTPTLTATATPTLTTTETLTATPTLTATETSTTTPTLTETPTLTATTTLTETPTLTATTTLTETPTLTATPSLTTTETLTATPSLTTTETLTVTPTLTETPTLTVTETSTATPTLTATETPTLTVTPTLTETATPTITPTLTATTTLTGTPTSTPTLTVTPQVLSSEGAGFTIGSASNDGYPGYFDVQVYNAHSIPLPEGKTSFDVPTHISGSDMNWIYMAPLEDASVGLRSDGTLWVWGTNVYGALGLGSYGPATAGAGRDTPTKIATENIWASASVGNRHMLALASDGTLWGAGNNFYGQLGTGDYGTKGSLTQIGSDSDWKNIFAGPDINFAIKQDGTLWGAGNGSEYKLGLLDTLGRIVFTIIDSGSWKKAAPSLKYTMAISSSGTMWAWGSYDNKYSMGLGPTEDYPYADIFPTQVGTGSNWMDVTVGPNHTLAIKADGTIWAAGNNTYGQLGIAEPTASYFTQIGTDTDWLTISTVGNSSYGIKTDGTLWSWGQNQLGQLGLEDTNNRFIPTRIGDDSTWVVVNNGSIIATHVFGIKGWRGPYPTTTPTLTPTLTVTPTLTPTLTVTPTSSEIIAESFTATSFESGDSHYALLRNDNTLWTWGYAGAPLGFNTEANVVVPTQVSGSWVSASINNYNLFGIKPDGTLWVCGDVSKYDVANGSNMLGLGNISSSVTMSLIDNGPWKLVSSGDFFPNHTLAIKSNGTLWATGENEKGSLGLGNTDNKLVFTQVGSDNDWKYANVGAKSSFAIKNNGTLWAWGDNYYGQLGLGYESPYGSDPNSPQQVGSYTDWVKIVGSYMWTIGLRANGTLWFAGTDNGQCAYPILDASFGASLINTGTTGIYATSPTSGSPAEPATYSGGVGSVNTSPIVYGPGCGYAGCANYSYVVFDGLNINWHELTITCNTGTISVNADYGYATLSAGETKTLYVVPYTTNIFIPSEVSNGIYINTSNEETATFTISSFRDSGIPYTASEFVQIGSDTDWVDIEMGDEYHIARKSDGTIHTWGANYYGMIGDGTTTDRCDIYSVDSGSTGWTDIAGGNYEGWGIKNNELYFWGLNYDDLSGVGGVINSPQLTPVQFISSSVVIY